MTSLVRFALRDAAPVAADRDRTAVPLAGGGSLDPADRYDPARPYQLNRQIQILSDIHDCAALLEQIARLPPGARLDADAAGELGAYVVDPGDPATVYWIDPGVHAIAELFAEPRTCGEVAELVCAAVGLPALASGVFEGLIRAGLLVAPAAPAP